MPGFSFAFSTHIPQAFSRSKIWNYFLAFTTLAALGKQNQTPNDIDVDVEAAVELRNSSRATNQVERDGPRLSSQLTYGCRVQKPGSWICQWKGNRWCGSSPRMATHEYCILRLIKLSCIYLTAPVPPISNLRVRSVMNHNLLKDVPHYWLPSCHIPLSLHDEALEWPHICPTAPTSNQPQLTIFADLSAFSMSSMFAICSNWHDCKRTVQSCKQSKFAVENACCRGWELFGAAQWLWTCISSSTKGEGVE